MNHNTIDTCKGQDDSHVNPIVRKNLQILPKIYGSTHRRRYSDFNQYFKKVIHSNKASSPQLSVREKKYVSFLQQIKEQTMANGVKTRVSNYKEIKEVASPQRHYNIDKMKFLSQPKDEVCEKKQCSCHMHQPFLDNKRAVLDNKRRSKFQVSSLQQICNGKKKEHIGRIIKLKPIKNYSTIAINTDEYNQEATQLREKEYVTIPDRESLHKINNNKPTGSINQLRKEIDREGLQRMLSYNSRRMKTEPVQNNKEENEQTIQRSRKKIEMNVKGISKINEISEIDIRVSDVSNKTSKKDNSLLKDIELSIQSKQMVRRQDIVLTSMMNQRKTIRSNTPLKNYSYQQIDITNQNAPNDQSYIDLSNLQNGRAKSSITEEYSQNISNTSRSISNILLSKNLFQSHKKVNTIFYSFAKQCNQDEERSISQSNIKLSRFHKQKDKIKSLFEIPQEEDYAEYLKRYKPMEKMFDIKHLILKPNFKIIRYQDGVYFGEATQDKKDGKGILVSEKKVYEGIFNNNIKVFGSEKNADGIYKGQFVKGMREGKGRFDWYNGEFFNGQWMAGVKEGYGVWKSPHGDCYEGEWKKNAQNGKGVYKFRTSIYDGEFVNFLKQGMGVQSFSNGDKYEGSYKMGKPHGKGKYIWQGGNFYEGDFVDGLREGRGYWYEGSTKNYMGQFHKDNKHGLGKEQYNDGQYFEGEFFEGSKLKGILVDRNKNVIQITSD